MVRNGNASRKRAADSEVTMQSDDDFDDETSGDGSDDENMEDADSVDEEMEEKLGSPSPEKRKDMVLRSGRRKRRRSKETSGLTPPEKAKATKKARPTTERKSKPATSNGAEVSEATKPPLPTSVPVVNRTIETATSSTTSATIKAGRESLLAMDPQALATAQDPEMYNKDDELLEPPDGDDDSTRQLFQSQTVTVTTPPPPATVIAPKPPVHDLPTTNGENHIKHHIPHEEEKETTHSVTIRPVVWRIIFMLVLALPFYKLVHPLCVALADAIIPLRELKLPAPIVNASTLELLPNEPPSSLQQAMENLQRLHDRVNHNLETLQDSRKKLTEIIDNLAQLVSERKAIYQRATLLQQADSVLRAALEEPASSSAPTWEQARPILQALGRTVLDTTSIDLWHIDELEGCTKILETTSTDTATITAPANPSSLLTEGHPDPLLQPSQVASLFKIWQDYLKHSTSRLMGSSATQELVREWIKVQIDLTRQGDEQINKKFAQLTAASNHGADGVDGEDRLGMADIQQIVQARLDMELADRTGEYDHAAIYNGARIIRTGKRATSKSLVDSLPLGNRLLQFWQLQFYGFGPEAAITPTYPFNALGQCWSFQQASIKVLVQRHNRRGAQDDHKSGSFGTLTISLRKPVRVSHVVIEHPPKGITDQRTSAIRSFRVIGYEDPDAMTKSLSLGSFEYDIESPEALQEFEVITSLLGKPVPPVHSISLAIDSNWGHDYACLYRFRVHGAEVDEEEDGGDDDDEDDDDDTSLGR